MKTNNPFAETVKRWIAIIDKVRVFHPVYAEYLGKNLLIDGDKGKMVYTGDIEVIAHLLESVFSKKTEK